MRAIQPKYSIQWEMHQKEWFPDAAGGLQKTLRVCFLVIFLLCLCVFLLFSCALSHFLLMPRSLISIISCDIFLGKNTGPSSSNW